MKKNESGRKNGRRKIRPQVPIERATISLPETLLDQAWDRAGRIRPATLSNYVGTLIERDIATAK